MNDFNEKKASLLKVFWKSRNYSYLWFRAKRITALTLKNMEDSALEGLIERASKNSLMHL